MIQSPERSIQTNPEGEFKMSGDFGCDFKIKSLKVDGRPVSPAYIAFASDYGGGRLRLHYNLETGIPNRFWHRIYTGDFQRLLRSEKYPETDDKEVEVEAVLVPEKSNGAADAEVPVRGRALRELVGMETADQRGTTIRAIHSLQMRNAKGAQA